jgi:hypothetical protein
VSAIDSVLARLIRLIRNGCYGDRRLTRVGQEKTPTGAGASLVCADSGLGGAQSTASASIPGRGG